MHHLELLLDDASEAAVVGEWRTLDVAGIPTQARHRSASNRPHLTLTMTREWPSAADRGAALGPLSSLPLEVRLGALVVFGRGPFVLVRLVVATEGLLEVQRAVVERMPSLASELLLPGRWTPHITLGRGLDETQVGRAVGLLGAGGERAALLNRARHWDSVARSDEQLS